MQSQAHGRSRLQRTFRKMLKFCSRSFGGLSLAVYRRYESVDYIYLHSLRYPRQIERAYPDYINFQLSWPDYINFLFVRPRLYQFFIRSTSIISFFDYIKELGQQLLDIIGFYCTGIRTDITVKHGSDKREHCNEIISRLFQFRLRRILLNSTRGTHSVHADQHMLSIWNERFAANALSEAFAE